MRCCCKRRTNAREGTKESLTKHLDARGVRDFHGWLVHAGGRSLSSTTVLIFTLTRSTRSNDAAGPKNGPPGEVLQRSSAPGRAHGRAQRVHKEAQGARTRKDAPVRKARDSRRIMFLCQKRKKWGSSLTTRVQENLLCDGCCSALEIPCLKWVEHSNWSLREQPKLAFDTQDNDKPCLSEVFAGRIARQRSSIQR